MEDEELVSLIAGDLARYLDHEGTRVDGPVYAISLWVEPVYAQLGAMLATQAAFERRRGLPLYRGISDEEAYGPAFRWYSGDWEVAPTDFTAARTQQALQPLASILNSGDDPGETDGRW